jgi:hypothetical protein
MGDQPFGSLQVRFIQGHKFNVFAAVPLGQPDRRTSKSSFSGYCPSLDIGVVLQFELGIKLTMRRSQGKLNLLGMHVHCSATNRLNDPVVWRNIDSRILRKLLCRDSYR